MGCTRRPWAIDPSPSRGPRLPNTHHCLHGGVLRDQRQSTNLSNVLDSHPRAWPRLLTQARVCMAGVWQAREGACMSAQKRGSPPLQLASAATTHVPTLLGEGSRDLERSPRHLPVAASGRVPDPGSHPALGPRPSWWGVGTSGQQAFTRVTIFVRNPEKQILNARSTKRQNADTSSWCPLRKLLKHWHLFIMSQTRPLVFTGDKHTPALQSSELSREPNTGAKWTCSPQDHHPDRCYKAGDGRGLPRVFQTKFRGR